MLRQTAGNYLSGDGRFEIRQSDTNWYLVDREQANEFGQELMHGPFSSLKAATAAVPGARDVKPLLKSAKRTPAPARKPKPSPKPRSWLNELSDPDRRSAQALINALEREGLPNPEDVVKRHRNDDAALAACVIEHRLATLVDESAAENRAEVRAIVRRVLEIVAVEGAIATRPLPRWQLTTLDADDVAVPGQRVSPRS